MKSFCLSNEHSVAPILVEDTAYEGVKRIADKVAFDIEMVCGRKPPVSLYRREITAPRVIVCATLDHSSIIDKLAMEKRIDIGKIAGRREVFLIALLEKPWEGADMALVICGSDKRGTIYGMFHLSEIIGVSPLVYWGDVRPAHRDTIDLDERIEMVSEEPSVKYRGFFINDEWPCFGNWTFQHFGGFNAAMYDRIFELLLRLKGNYLWPAMWSSSFPLDGPGMASAELADIYGVIMGTSHHEPCMRASEEWDKVRGGGSSYGNEWNYYTNREGLINYWRDGLIRGAGYESIITIGMRGERDTSMLGQDATLKENIELLKDIITEQRKLIAQYVNSDLNQVPQLLVLYKEVEDYFYGDRESSGLKDWEELNEVTCMLCEDNYGNVRTLPEKAIRNREGGWGMYYHFDYHGAPVSYEWVNSTPISKVWEQMCMAYDYGIRDIWIVNVGDLKFNEFPLSFFMELAYDYNTWGSGSVNSIYNYTFRWMAKQFGSYVADDTIREMIMVHDGYIRINSLRRPEALNENVYHPVHEGEADRLLTEAGKLMDKAQDIYSRIPNECKAAYYSMVYFPAMASLNLLKLHLYAGKNRHYALQGKKIANTYAKRVTECIRLDRKLAEEFGKAFDGKWKGMELASHTGFRQWNEDNCRYPIRYQVEPAGQPRMVVSRADGEPIAHKVYGGPMVLPIRDFLSAGNTDIDIEIANDGIGSFKYMVTMEPCKWLEVTPASGVVEDQVIVKLKCDRSCLPVKEAMVRMYIKGADTTVVLEVYGQSIPVKGLPYMTFLENKGIFTIDANHYCDIMGIEASNWVELKGYGRYGFGLKHFPVTRHYEPWQDSPTVTYRVDSRKEGRYILELLLAPSNPVHKGMGMRYGVIVNRGELKVVDAIPYYFRAGVSTCKDWAEGVLDNIRCSKTEIMLVKGINEIAIKAIDPGLIIERLRIYLHDFALPASYLGPAESFHTD